MLDPGFQGLVDGLYEVATAPGLWQSWLTQLCEAMRARVGLLALRFEAGVGDRGIFAVGIPDLTVEEIRASLRSSDLFTADARLLNRALALAPGELVVLSETLPDDEFVATRFYREWIQPRELHHLVSLMVSRTRTQLTGLTLLRQREHASFSPAELALLRRLHPHLQRVIQIQELLLAAELKLEVAEEMLEAVGGGAILLGEEGQVTGANRRAAALLERGEGLRIDRNGRLQTENPREAEALQRLVRSATQPGRDRTGGVLAVSRAARRFGLIVSVTPLHGRARSPWPPVTGALVLLGDRDGLPTIHEPALQELYGLTQAEARVASRIAQGETIDEISVALGVQPATARSHLKQALAKTDTHRQAELVRLLLLGA